MNKILPPLKPIEPICRRLGSTKLAKKEYDIDLNVYIKQCESRIIENQRRGYYE